MNPLLKFVAKQLFGQKGVIANNKAVNFEAAKLAEKLSEFGIDPSSIKTEKQLEGIVNQIKELQKKRMAESMEVISQDDPRFKGIMDKMMGSNVIKRDFGKPFKEEIKKMETEAEIAKRIKKDNKKGIANIQKRILEEDREIENLYGGAGFGKDQEIDAEFLAEYLAENAGKVYDDLPTMERLDFYDRAFNALTRYKRTKGTSVIDEPKKLDPRTKEKIDDIKDIEDPEDKADGGRIGFNTGSGLPLDPMDPNNKLNAVINAFKKLPSRSQNRIGFKKFFEIYARENFADGGRIGFKMGRRAFLKALGAGIGGAAALKTGILKILGTKKAVTGAGEKIITAPVKGKPEWFDALVNKVIREGDNVTKQFSTKEREIVHKLDIDNLDDVTVTQDLDEGIVRVEYNSPNNMGEDTVELVFKSGRDQMDETTGKVADEFYAIEKEPRAVGGPEDADLEFDGENFVRSVDDLQSDTSKLKEVATGKKQTLGEFVNSKKKKDRVKSINEDQVEQAEYLETKYGPYERYLSEDVDADFASGGLAGMLGQ